MTEGSGLEMFDALCTYHSLLSPLKDVEIQGYLHGFGGQGMRVLRPVWCQPLTYTIIDPLSMPWPRPCHWPGMLSLPLCPYLGPFHPSTVILEELSKYLLKERKKKTLPQHCCAASSKTAGNGVSAVKRHTDSATLEYSATFTPPLYHLP